MQPPLSYFHTPDAVQINPYYTLDKLLYSKIVSRSQNIFYGSNKYISP